MDNPDAQAALVRYLVVRTAGYLEASRDELANAHVTQQASPRVAQRLKAGLSTGVGVRPAQLRAFLFSFDPEWAAQLDVFFAGDDSRLSNQLGALVEARKNIAHGLGDPVRESQAIRWAETANEVVEWLTALMDPSK